MIRRAQAAAWARGGAGTGPLTAPDRKATMGRSQWGRPIVSLTLRSLLEGTTDRDRGSEEDLAMSDSF